MQQAAASMNFFMLASAEPAQSKQPYSDRSRPKQPYSDQPRVRWTLNRCTATAYPGFPGAQVQRSCTFAPGNRGLGPVLGLGKGCRRTAVPGVLLACHPADVLSLVHDHSDKIVVTDSDNPPFTKKTKKARTVLTQGGTEAQEPATSLHAWRDPLRDKIREVGRGLSLADTQTGR